MLGCRFNGEVVEAYCLGDAVNKSAAVTVQEDAAYVGLVVHIRLKNGQSVTLLGDDDGAYMYSRECHMALHTPYVMPHTRVCTYILHCTYRVDVETQQHGRANVTYTNNGIGTPDTNCIGAQGRAVTPCIRIRRHCACGSPAHSAPPAHIACRHLTCLNGCAQVVVCGLMGYLGS